MDNPFNNWQVVRIDPDQPIPVKPLVAGALGGTVDDQSTEHGLALFEALAERGPEAWRASALLLVQYLASGSPSLGAGRDDADRYLAGQPLDDTNAPAVTLMHRAIAGAIDGGVAGVDAVLAAAAPAQVAGAVRYLFALACLSSGYPSNRTDELMYAFCSGVR